jgi:hypothetical protein
MTGTSARAAIVLCGLLAAVPAAAEEMSPEEARRFVVGKQFTYTCFEGTTGAGRIQADGSVAGYIRVGGKGQHRYVTLPANTLRVKGASVCASVRGMPFEPCFNLKKTSHASFRGSVSGLGFAYCDFNRRNARADVAQGPLQLHPVRSASAGN